MVSTYSNLDNIAEGLLGKPRSTSLRDAPRSRPQPFGKRRMHPDPVLLEKKMKASALCDARRNAANKIDVPGLAARLDELLTTSGLRKVRKQWATLKMV